MTMCKPGSHYVKQHIRISVNGKSHVVNAHCRINPKSKVNTLFASNLNYLFKQNKKEFKKLKSIKGFKDHGQYDQIIQFWLNYWKSKKLINFDIDPLIIKALIAVESSFREKVITKDPNSSATGLMQITRTTMNILAGKKGKEIKKHNIEITQEDAQNANINIATGTRWLIHKIKTSPFRKYKDKHKRLFGGIKYYYSWSSSGEEYAKKVLKIYEKSK